MGLFGKKKSVGTLFGISGRWLIKDMACLECGRPMRVVLGFGTEGTFPLTEAIARAEATGYLKGSFQCGGCGGCFCWGCSDREKVCPCGRQSTGHWKEVWYIER